MFFVLDYEIPVDKALFIYAFTQNYTQTVIARRDNKELISIELCLLGCVNVNVNVK